MSVLAEGMRTLIRHWINVTRSRSVTSTAGGQPYICADAHNLLKVEALGVGDVKGSRPGE